MAAQALSFCSNFWGSSKPSSSSSLFQHHQTQQHINPNTTVTFPQRKRPRSSNNNTLSLSSISSNPNCSFNSNTITPITQNTNPFYNHTPTFFPTDHLFAENPSFFDPPSSQTLIPPLHQDYHNYTPTNPSFFVDASPAEPEQAIPDFSSPEDQLLLASFLAEPAQINAAEFPVPQESRAAADVPVKKQCGGPGVSPQSVAARERRRRITERTSELGKLIPGGNKMSTAEMFQAAYKYVKFLQSQVSLLRLLAESNQVYFIDLWFSFLSFFFWIVISWFMAIV